MSCFRFLSSTSTSNSTSSPSASQTSTRRRNSDITSIKKYNRHRRASVDPSIYGNKSLFITTNDTVSYKHRNSLAPDIFITNPMDYGSNNDEIFRKTTRQKTETSLPADEVTTDSTHLDAKTRIRRTSSMPSVYDELHEHASEGKILRHYNYDAKLSKLQKRALRFTWHRLQTRNGGKRIETVFEEVYDRLMKQIPVMREIFTTRTFLSAMAKEGVATLRDHARMTVKMIDSIIKNLDTETRKRTDTDSEFDPRILGKVHGSLRPYGFNSNFWEKFGEIFIDVVLVQEAVRDLPGAGQSWVILTACLVDQLRAGFDQAKEKQSITSTLNEKTAFTCPVFHGYNTERRDSNNERRRSYHPSDIYDNYDSDEHIYVNFPPQNDSKNGSPMHSSHGSPLHHTPRQLPLEPSKPTFSLTTDTSIDPIR